MNALDILDNVFCITDELKKEFPKLKSLNAIEGWSYDTDHLGDWKYACLFSKSLKSGGHSDWRLPTMDELRTLFKACKCNRLNEVAKEFPIKTDFGIVLKNFTLWSVNGDRFDMLTGKPLYIANKSTKAAILCVR